MCLLVLLLFLRSLIIKKINIYYLRPCFHLDVAVQEQVPTTPVSTRPNSARSQDSDREGENIINRRVSSVGGGETRKEN